MQVGRRTLGVTALAALGTFVAAVTALGGSGGAFEVHRYKVGSHPIDIAVGDFNRDGRKDLVVTNFEGDPTRLSILRGRKGGRFARARTIRLAPGDQPDGVAVARLGTGKDQDLVVGNLADDLLLFRGLKGMRFAAPRRIALGEWPRRPVTGDFDHDGLTDIAVGRQQTDDTLVMMGTGGLNFGPAAPYAEGGGGHMLATRLDPGDDLDLLTVDFEVDGLSLLRGNPNGTFDPAESLFAGGDEAASIAAADLNGDGRKEIIEGYSATTARIGVARGEDAGTFADPETQTVGSGPMMVEDIAVTRLNRDRDPDLVVVGRRLSADRAAGRQGAGEGPVRSRVIFLRGRPGIKFRRMRELGYVGQANAVAAARLDRGGSADAVALRYRSDQRSHAVVILNP